MWDLLIGLRAKVSKTDEIGEITLFGSEKGEKTVFLLLENGKKAWFLFSEIQIIESDFLKKMEQVDQDIFNLQEKKFSLINFFLVFPNKLLK